MSAIAQQSQHAARRTPHAAFRGAGLLVLAAACAGLEAAEHVPVSVTPAPEHASAGLEDRLAQPITAELQAVDFASAMAFLSESAGLNILLSEQARAVGRPVTIHLVAMPLGRVLEHVLKGQGLVLRRDG